MVLQSLGSSLARTLSYPWERRMATELDSTDVVYGVVDPEGS
jgi:hypothetical protein